MKRVRFFVLIFFFSVILISCSAKKKMPPKTVFAMNTVCTVNLFDDGTAELYEMLFNRLRELELIFDVNNPDSEISRVNALATPEMSGLPVSEDLANVLSVALSLAEKTDGAFNPACGPLVKLWSINTDHAKVPTAEELAETIPLCDYKNVIFTSAPNSVSGGGDNSSASNSSAGGVVQFAVQGMSLDLGGIAKGYAADELVSILKSQNVKRAIIDLGGNIYVYGKKKDGKPWKVGIKNPLDLSGAPKLILECDETSLVTSGVYERFFEQDGKRYHHILDCKTGYPVENGIASVTIECKSSLWADALSTALFVLGHERIEEMDFGRLTPDFNYVIIMNDGEVKKNRLHTEGGVIAKRYF